MRAAAAVIVLAACSGDASYREFLAERHAIYCEQLTVCDPGAVCDQPIEIDTGGISGQPCHFDASVGRDCLDGEWTCSDAVPEYGMPIPPVACDQVCEKKKKK